MALYRINMTVVSKLHIDVEAKDADDAMDKLDEWGIDWQKVMPDYESVEVDFVEEIIGRRIDVVKRIHKGQDV